MTTIALPKIAAAEARTKGILSALVGTLLISFDSVFVRLSGTDGVNTVFLFGLFTVISMSVMLQISDQRGVVGTLKEDGWPVVISGLLMFDSACCFILSIKFTAVANTVIIMASRPVLTAIFSWLFLKETADKSLWLAIIMVVGGIAVVISGSLESVNLFGDSLALLCVIFLALNGTYQRHYTKMSRIAVVGIAGVWLAAVLLPFADVASLTPGTWLIMAAMGLLSAPFGRVLTGVSTRYILAAEAAMISMSMSVFSTSWAFLLFNEIPPAATLAGGSLILGAISSYIFLKLRRA
ncbi:DMT family transporter [uncultured Desulfuromonas sp.]|uniref:DMT family transporter n=1 Tax=uncultured Desulfuromonas sp. TaxID=181013 RepID=UPI002AAC14FF|nr:DMT family transporter [uncultured Desulfuromonas sp.]